MRITALKQQIKNPERVSVFVDGKYSFSLTLNEVISEKIKNGLELDEARLKNLKKISADGKLRARALEWVMNRPRSVREFHDYLRRKKVEPEFIERLSDEFVDRKQLDDLRFTAWYIELAQRKNRSIRAIRSELFKKGISKDMMDQSLENAGLDEPASLKELAAKKRKLARYKNDDVKLARYLTSQGFSYQDVKDALKVESED